MTITRTPASKAFRKRQTESRDTAIVKSAARVLKILEYFDDVKHEARVGEITDRLGYPQSSTTYLLKSMTQMGYLDYHPSTRTYLPTPRVALMGAWIGGPELNDGILIRLLKDISEVTGRTVVMGVRNGVCVQSIHAVESGRRLAMHVPIGTSWPLVWSPMGFALLKDESDQAVRSLVTRTNAESAGMHSIKIRDVLAHISTFRLRGYFVSDETISRDNNCISMLLPAELTARRAIAIALLSPTDAVQDNGWLIATVRSLIEQYRSHKSHTSAEAVRQSEVA